MSAHGEQSIARFPYDVASKSIRQAPLEGWHFQISDGAHQNIDRYNEQYHRSILIGFCFVEI